MSLMKEYEHLQIPLKDIKSATNNFSATNLIGQGGSGKIYKGQLSRKSREGERLTTMVAVKLFNHAFREEGLELWNDIVYFSQLIHVNLVSMIGFCNKGESILVYEYHPRQSLDLYLGSTNLSWSQRLDICIGAACGINYLHNCTNKILLHRNIKSSNILLDQNGNAKITDFVGLYDDLYKYEGTNHGYVDPSYVESGIFSNKSDVYSLGVVLCEVLCGRLCIQDTQDKRRPLTALVRQRYEENKLDTLVKTSIKEQISPDCFQVFSAIAYNCLRQESEDRPSIQHIVSELEIARQYQEAYEKKKSAYEMEESDSDDEGDFWEARLPQDWKGLITKFNIPRAIYTIKRDLFSLLHNGILFDEGNKFLWINNDGTKCVLISAKRFVELNEGKDHRWVFQHGSSRHLIPRFPVVVEYLYGKWHEIRCQIKTSILSLGTMYATNLVFKYSKKPNEDLKHLRLMRLRWKVEKSSVYSVHYAELTHDKWYKIRMWNFLNQGPSADFDIELEELSYYDNPVESGLLIQGIEFQPIEMVQHKEIKRINSLLIPDEEDIDDDLYWEKKLPNDYHRYIEISDKHIHYTSKKELYLFLCAGFLAYGGKLWLFLCKSTGGICSILPATHNLCEDTSYESLETLSLSKSRFREVKELGTDDWYLFTCILRSFMFSPNYIYACYLVFKFEDNHVLSNNVLPARTKSSFRSSWKARIRSSKSRIPSLEFFKVECKLGDIIQGTVFAHMNSTPPINIPKIVPKNNHGSDASSNVRIVDGYGMPKGHMDLQNSWMEERNDGWMEVRLSKSLYQLEKHVSLEVKLWKPEDGSFSGIIVEGIEFRPMRDVSDF